MFPLGLRSDFEFSTLWVATHSRLTVLSVTIIILLEWACLHNRIGRNWCKFSRPECVTSLKTARSLANGPIGGELRGNCPRIAVSPISHWLWRSMWAELNGGENSLQWKANICSLYLVLWLSVLSVGYEQSKRVVLHFFKLVWLTSTGSTRCNLSWELNTFIFCI